MQPMRWTDRVYGDATIDDPLILALIAGPTFQRLRGIKQAGPSALAFPFKEVTRFEHSLGVYLLLRRLGADPKQQVAGLLHDISHTAFSHAVDFVFASELQDHHEGLKPVFLHREDLMGPLAALGYEPADFYDDAIYPLLEQPLPRLCADRLDYFFRDSLACGVTNAGQVGRFLDHLAVVDSRSIAFTDPAVAQEAADWFAVMNADWWASPTEAFIYNEFADSLRAAFESGVLDKDALLEDDASVLIKLQTCDDPLVLRKLNQVVHFAQEAVVGFQPRVRPKTRWIDPPVVKPPPISRPA